MTECWICRRTREEVQNIQKNFPDVDIMYTHNIGHNTQVRICQICHFLIEKIISDYSETELLVPDDIMNKGLQVELKGEMTVTEL